MRNYFTYDETPSTDFGVYISGSGTFTAPEREFDVIQIPGRDGDLIGLSGRLNNVDITYPAFIYSNFAQNIGNLRDFLLSRKSYKKLIDTYHTDEYRMAYYAGGLEPEMVRNLRAGTFDITFRCKPQRYLTSGDTPTEFTASGSIVNPTNQNSAPLLRIWGTGTVQIGTGAVTLTASPGYVDVDCEIMESYYGTTSMNGITQVQGTGFPMLHAGTNGVVLGTGITKVKVWPRWWRA